MVIVWGRAISGFCAMVIRFHLSHPASRGTVRLPSPSFPLHLLPSTPSFQVLAATSSRTTMRNTPQIRVRMPFFSIIVSSATWGREPTLWSGSAFTTTLVLISLPLLSLHLPSGEAVAVKIMNKLKILADPATRDQVRSVDFPHLHSAIINDKSSQPASSHPDPGQARD